MRLPCDVDGCETGQPAVASIWNSETSAFKAANMCNDCAIGYVEYLDVINAKTGHSIEIRFVEIEDESGPTLPKVNSATVNQRGSGARLLGWLIPLAIGGLFVAYQAQHASGH